MHSATFPALFLLATLLAVIDDSGAASVAVAVQRDYRQNCFPIADGGCQCNVRGANGIQSTIKYHSEADCKIPVELKTIENKQKLTEEIEDRFGQFKDECFPRPRGGCSCNEKDAAGNEIVKKYDADSECKISIKKKRSSERPSQNVRDPVRERAQANYRAVINELNEKFKGLKEGCFPRPRGCMCVIGKNPDGREITERRLKDKDCKCQPGERSKGCPVGGA